MRTHIPVYPPLMITLKLCFPAALHGGARGRRHNGDGSNVKDIDIFSENRSLSFWGGGKVSRSFCRVLI